MEKSDDAQRYESIAATIRENFLPVFGDHERTRGGWLRASTGISSQSDVWGSIYAIYVGAVRGKNRKQLLETITAALEKEGEIEMHGALRHVPVSEDASPTSAWERAMVAKNTYMNGAYWHTPTGWLIAALHPDYPTLADRVKSKWLNFLRSEEGNVWECINANQNPSFGPAITLPMGVLKFGEGSFGTFNRVVQ